jgi:hypothetical protein
MARAKMHVASQALSVTRTPAYPDPGACVRDKILCSSATRKALASDSNLGSIPLARYPFERAERRIGSASGAACARTRERNCAREIGRLPRLRKWLEGSWQSMTTMSF